MPEQESARALELLADLHVSVSSERGDAAAHLHGGGDALFLDVDHPAVLLSEVRGQEFPLLAVRDVISDIPVRVRSQGRELARISLRSNGTVRVRPTPAGLLTGLRIALSGLPGGRWVRLGSPLLVLAGIVAYRSRQRST